MQLLSGAIPDNKIRIAGLSTSVRHALQALAAMKGQSQRAGDVARRRGLPEAALSKIFQRLAKFGLLESRRGPGGGYRLARSPAETSLAAVADALEPSDRRHGRCLIEDRPCGGGAVCALHAAGVAAEAQLRGAMSSLTLADLAPRRRVAAGRAAK